MHDKQNNFFVFSETKPLIFGDTGSFFYNMKIKEKRSFIFSFDVLWLLCLNLRSFREIPGESMALLDTDVTTMIL